MFARLSGPVNRAMRKADAFVSIAGIKTAVKVTAKAGADVIEIVALLDPAFDVLGAFLEIAGLISIEDDIKVLATAKYARNLPGGGTPMTYIAGDFDRNHLGLTFGGLLPGNEIWVCSLKLAGGTEGSVGAEASDVVLNEIDLQGLMESSIADAVKTYFQAPQTGISNACWLTYAKLSRYGRNGLLRNSGSGEVFEHVYPAGTTGNSTQATFPNQIALAVSLTTNFTRGPAHRGRFYLPMPTFPVTNAVISQSSADGVAETTKTFLEAIADEPGVDLPASPNVVVMSRKADAATTHEVKGVSVGRAYDTIRTRRGKVAESYVNLAIDQGVN